MINGKQVRMKKLFPHKKGVFLALDHGFSMGPIKGLENIDKVIGELSSSPIDAIIINYGAFKNLDIKSLTNCRIPFILHLTGSGLDQNSKQKSTLYRGIDALKMGADAVSIQINIGVDNESSQIIQAAQLISECDTLGLPVMLMIYDKTDSGKIEDRTKAIVRMALELGSDILKIDVKEDSDFIEELIKNSNIPILFAGGDFFEKDNDFLNKINWSISNGASGISVGRNIFEHYKSKDLLNKVCQIVHDKE